MSEPSHDHDLVAIHNAAGRDWGDVTSVEADGDFLLIRMRIDGDAREFGVRLAAPWSDMLQPWLYAPPEDTTDWASQLGTWLQEEIDTGAAQWAMLTERDGMHWFTAEPYGFRRQDEAEHGRMLGLAPLGWRGPYRTPAGERRWLGDTEWPERDSAATREIERLERQLDDVLTGASNFVTTRRQNALHAAGGLVALAIGVLLCWFTLSDLLLGEGDRWDAAQFFGAVALVVLLLPRAIGAVLGLLAMQHLRGRRQRPAPSSDSET